MAGTQPSPSPSLTQSAVSGTAWSTMSTVGRQLLSIASVTTVARLLGPSAYGVMGMANLLMVFILNFRDLGTGMAIIQRSTVSNKLLSSLFWLNCSLGIVMSLTVAASSPLAAKFFKTSELIPILCALSISFWFASCGVVHNSLVLRGMRFKQLATVDLSAGLAGYAVALGCAFNGLGVWSLVYANLANSLTATVGYWIASGWRPAWEFDRTEVRSIARFSLNLSGFGLVNYFSRNADNIIVGRVLGRAQLGDYQMAYNLMLAPIQNISSVISQATFPAFARIQNDNERFRQAYIRSCMLIGLVTFPVMAGLGVTADPLIRAVLGTKWVGAIRIFQILAPVGLVQSVQTTVGQVYTAKGRTDWMFRWGLAQSIIVVSAFLIGVRYGTVGVATSYLIAYFGLTLTPGLMIPFRAIELRIQDFVKALLPQILVTAGMTLLCGLWLHWMPVFPAFNEWIRLISTVLLGAIFYCGALLLLRPAVMRDLGTILAHSQNPVAARLWIALNWFSRPGKESLFH